MPLFGKSRVQKAIEERDTILRSIQQDIPSQVKTKLPQRDMKFAEIVKNRVINKGILTLDKSEDVRAVICNIPDTFGEAKYYFLEAVWYFSSLMKSFDQAEGTHAVSGYLPYFTGLELCKYLNEQGLPYMGVKKYEDAIQEFSSGLEIAREIKHPYFTGLFLRNIAGCQYGMGKVADAKASLQEAVGVLNKRIADPKCPLETKKQLQTMVTEYSGLISEM